ncbi:two-component hybrid sensor and regulator [Calothrix sp. NIES-4071]|nr:two-component hybrid sensor and regulator [Calothrix sp. NIES-4071]BAZ54427.1 two-component hybrid sensor and regulator [Calothrix sp. NIES-4105]
MWSRYQAFIRNTRSVLIITPAIALTVIVSQSLGLFNLSEWKLRDQWVRLQSQQKTRQKPASEIVIVTIDERDIQSVGKWPIPDWSLAQLLEKIRAQQPRAIGLDLYRDLKEGTGYEQLAEIFRTTPNLIGVEKITGERVNPPPELKKNDQVGLADLVLDGDRHVRRALLTATDAKEEGKIKAGLATRVALKYLEAERITLESVDEKQLKFKLGKTIYQPLKNYEAGYSNADVGGYQILINWYGSETAFRTVSMRDVLAGNIPADLMRERMVFIGSTAASTNDFFSTPFSSSLIYAQKPTPGVAIHANIASQLVQGAKVQSTIVHGVSANFLYFWIVLWSAIGSSSCWYLASVPTKRRIPGGIVLWSTISISTVFVVGAYKIFLAGLLIPVTPALVAFVSSVIATVNAYKQQKLEEINQQLETKVEERTHELLEAKETLEQQVKERTAELTKSLQQLQDTQLQMIQSEKMSALGNLVAGIAHEMNNPLSFISASLEQAKPTISDIIEHLQLYQKTSYNEEILNHASEIDLDYYIEDLPVMIDSMVMACERIQNISNSLRTFSRADRDCKQPFNLQEGIDSTILILKHRLKANEQRPAIEVSINYCDSPLVECFPGQLNQVFMNIIANAIDALDESSIGRSFKEISNNPNQITITTCLINEYVKIIIADNGIGMSEEVKQHIFEHLFTTKQVNKGTGLGLAIAKQIIVEKHSGSIEVNSTVGSGTEFIILLPL